MKIVIPGGTGHVGAVLSRSLRARGHDVVILSRGKFSDARVVHWDGRTLGAWAGEIDGANVVINLAGRSVNCRYTAVNLKAMISSRVNSTRAVGRAIEQALRPPRLWLQMSTATIYAHRFDAPNNETTGVVGGEEPDAPRYWRFSIDIAQAWERAQAEANTISDATGREDGFVGSDALGYQRLVAPGGEIPGNSTYCEGINNFAQVVCLVEDLAMTTQGAFIGSPVKGEGNADSSSHAASTRNIAASSGAPEWANKSREELVIPTMQP